jgi:hypothetical protein
MKPLKAILPFFFLLLINCGIASDDESNASQPINSPKPDMAMLRSKAIEAKQYCRQKNLNTDFYILIDLSRHSGLKRFFVWDLNNNKITNSFLVSHGSCDNPWAQDFSKTNVKTSNVEDSHCSSVGKYIIEERGLSQWGIKVKYLMHGQEPTNNNATKRAIVFHSWEKVSDEEVYPAGTPEGWGCPAISNKSMKIMDDKIKASDKRVLMWIVK